MTDLDDLLSMVENPTRRRILEALVAEPRYPLQLSKELGVSQQAVMKNLTLLERHGLVMSHPSRVFLQTSKFPIHQCQRPCLSKDFLRASQLQRRSNIKDQKPLTNSSVWPAAIPHGLQKNQARDITGCARRNKPERPASTVHRYVWLEHLVLMQEARASHSQRNPA